MQQLIASTLESRVEATHLWNVIVRNDPLRRQSPYKVSDPAMIFRRVGAHIAMFASPVVRWVDVDEAPHSPTGTEQIKSIIPSDAATPSEPARSIYPTPY